MSNVVIRIPSQGSSQLAGCSRSVAASRRCSLRGPSLGPGPCDCRRTSRRDLALMDKIPPEIPAGRPPHRTHVASPMATILLAISFGLCAGFLDLGALLFKKYCWNSEGYFRNARDFPWTVPVGHAALMVVPGLVVIAVNRFRPRSAVAAQRDRGSSRRSRSGRLSENAVVRSMQSAAGGRVGSSDRRRGCVQRGFIRVGCDRSFGAARRRRMCPGGSLVGLAVGSGIPVRGRTSCPRPAHSQRRIDRLGHRPCLQREHLRLFPQHHTQPGTVGTAGCHVQVRDGSGTLDVSVARLFLHRPVAPQCQFAVEIHLWTLPASHWPNTCPNGAIRLAGSWQTQTAAPMRPVLRGFAHFEDYPLTPWAILSRTVPGKWILENPYFGNSTSRSGSACNPVAQGDQPGFFALARPTTHRSSFLCRFELLRCARALHPTAGICRPLRDQPKTTRDYQFLVDFVAVNKHQTSERDYRMARDCYDSCIALLMSSSAVCSIH